MASTVIPIVRCYPIIRETEGTSFYKPFSARERMPSAVKIDRLRDLVKLFRLR